MNSNKTHYSQLKYRADIDGLRGIAVLLVVCFHAFPTVVKGGFIGVDIFFVISGFLISQIIYKGVSSKSLNLFTFYMLRIKRIFPALIFVLCAVFVLGWYLLLPDEYNLLHKHIFGGSVFLSNYVLWHESGYFDNLARSKPLLHLWSLSVEEQFYLLWPFLIFLFSKFRFNLLLVTVAVFIVSFFCNTYFIDGHVDTVFYAPITRLWELLLGAILSYFVLNNNKNALFNNNRMMVAYSMSTLKRLTAIISFFSVVILLISATLITKEDLFPGYWALLPTIGTILIILTGPDNWFNQTILSNKILVWFGLISFPLYLWHWPLLSFSYIYDNDDPITNRLIVVLISMVLAWLTYHLIEKPIPNGKHEFGKVAVLTLLLVLISQQSYQSWLQKAGYPERIIYNTTQLAPFLFEPHMGFQVACKARFPLQDQCLETETQKPHDALLIGDSHAHHYFSGFSRIFRQNHKNLVLMGAGGCLPFFNIQTGQIGNVDYCEKKINTGLQYAIDTSSVKTIILAS